MSDEELGILVTRVTIWIALACYTLSVAHLVWHGRRENDRPARALWTAGCVAYLAHVAAAFHFYFHDSHAEALAHAAQRTLETTGSAFPEGMYVNYFFTAVWVADVDWWWLAPEAYKRRPLWIHALVHGLFVFMIFNATIVFGSGPIRPATALVAIALAVIAWTRRGKRAT